MLATATALERLILKDEFPGGAAPAEDESGLWALQRPAARRTARNTVDRILPD